MGSETLLIVCAKPKCPRTKRTPRQPHDPVEAVKIEMFCPWHGQNGGKSEHVVYYDAKGRDIMWEPADA